jgi:hypothetical protein
MAHRLIPLTPPLFSFYTTFKFKTFTTTLPFSIKRLYINKNLDAIDFFQSLNVLKLCLDFNVSRALVRDKTF